MEEIFKPIKYYEKLYIISKFGKIRSLKTNKIIKQRLNKKGYKIVSLIENKKTLYKYVHRLVAFTFHEDNRKNNIVDHIDGDKTNNYYKNLRFVSQSENTINAYKNNKNMKSLTINQIDKNNIIIKTYLSLRQASLQNNISTYTIRKSHLNNKYINDYKWIIKNNTNKKNVFDRQNIKYKNEKFITINNFFDEDFSNYKISNFGRVKNKNNKILKQYNNGGYYNIKIMNKNKTSKTILVHRLVAFIFVNKNKNKNMVVNHKDENTINNYFKNLEWISNRDNIVYSSGKKIIQLKNNKIINTYKCIKDACKILNINHGGNITKCCKNKIKTAYGYNWKYN
jgi:hypothetical protein